MYMKRYTRETDTQQSKKKENKRNTYRYGQTVQSCLANVLFSLWFMFVFVHSA